MENNKIFQNELYHHGISGMRWHIRRYQNKDGTLTELGKQHYGKGGTADKRTSHIRSTIKKALEKIKTTGKNFAENRRKKDYKKLTTQELKELTERIKAEADYKEAENRRHEAGRGFVSKFVGKQINNFADKAISTAVNKMFEKKDIPEIASLKEEKTIAALKYEIANNKYKLKDLQKKQGKEEKKQGKEETKTSESKSTTSETKSSKPDTKAKLEKKTESESPKSDSKTVEKGKTFTETIISPTSTVLKRRRPKRRPRNY